MNKELIFLNGYANGRKLYKTMKAINIAKDLHRNQTRKTGEPYINHPVRIATQLMELSHNIPDGCIDLDILLAVALLHDVIEDCNISHTELTSMIGKEIADRVEILSKSSDYKNDLYYTAISQDCIASLVKISDRCNNISTMADVSV